MTHDEALQLILRMARNEVEHTYQGECPDGYRPHSRDPECEVCRALDVLAIRAPAQPEITWATCKPWDTLTTAEKAESLIEELEATAERITRHSNSPLDGLLHEAANVLRELTAAPAQPEPKVTSPEREVTSPGQSHQPEPMGEPVAWQMRDRPDGAWQAVSEATYKALSKLSRFDRRPLYLRPPAASTPAVPDTPTTPSESEAYLAGFADCAAGRAAATVEGAAWQPIETAPKDGTNVLLINNAGNMAAGMWLGGASGQAWFLRGGSGPDAFFNGAYGPTHWMPLPPPPAAPKEKP